MPQEYFEVLQVVNGLEFNGYIIYGVDERLIEGKPDQNINGCIEHNGIWYENEWQKKYIFIGESNISWYVYDIVKKSYIELDNPSGREVMEYDNIGDMIEKILTDALM